ncbi:MAG: gliding motility protein GldL [Muribaculaceae bacterium]|nr:gliding motility protein GldL [Muribaculaceae bacterium]
MVKVEKVRRGIGAFISSEKGQRFFNFAYSIGAAIVIWGALFKILHLPGGNALLSIGMGTEVLMFVLTAFDRPAKEYRWEEVFPALAGKKGEGDEDGVAGPVMGGHSGPVYIGGGSGIPSAAPHLTTPAENIVVGADGMPSVQGTTANYLEQMAELAAQMQHLRVSTEALNQVSDTLLESYRAITENSENITRSSQGYVEQMQSLNRNITGLNTIYEIQLKSISSQLDAIDRVNQGIKDIRDMYERSASQSTRYCEETEKMARYMQQLNQVYERMITAMTINMYNPMMAQAAAAPAQAPQAPETPAQSAE